MRLSQVVIASVLSISAGQAWAEAIVSPPPPAPAGAMPDVKVGDHWEYDFHAKATSSGSGTVEYDVQRVDATEIDVKAHIRRAGGKEILRDFVFDHAWRTLSGPLGQYIRTSADGGPFPAIAVGKTWKHEVLWQPTNSGSRFKMSGHGEVVGRENVTLTNGKTYDAFKILTHLETASVEGSGFQEVKAGQTLQKIVVESVTWYAPEVNRYVKETSETSRDGKVEQTSVEELKDYGRAP